MLTLTMVNCLMQAHLRLIALGYTLGESAALLHLHQQDVDALTRMAKETNLPKLRQWLCDELALAA